MTLLSNFFKVLTYDMSLDRRGCKVQLDWCTEGYKCEVVIQIF